MEYEYDIIYYNNHNLPTNEQLYYIKSTLQEVANYYPHFDTWWDKVITQLKDNTENRTIIVVYDALISMPIGICIYKNTKICTLYVVPKYRKTGLGTLLLKEALQNVKCPIMTVPSPKLEKYITLLKKYKFIPIDVLQDKYVEHDIEYVFGSIINEN